MRRRAQLLLVALVALVHSASLGSAPAAAKVTTCGPETVTLEGTVGPEDETTYAMLPIDVPDATARIEVAYTWDPIDGGVVDLGTWDSSGTAGPDAFRSWSGNRQGRIDLDMDPVVIAPGRIERTVVDGGIEPGTWHVELGFAAVEVDELNWHVEVTCPTGVPDAPLEPDPVDPTHVARDEPGWYAGDFHLHAFHSHPEGPDPEQMVAYARSAGLDIVPVTEYVTPAHWDTLGATQREHEDLLIWPGREVITYHGHMVVLGETPSVVEHRVGHDGIRLPDIQRAAARDGALVSLAHPTVFPPEQFGSTCRGCFLELVDDVDWAATHLVEVVSNGSLAEVNGVEVPNPFVRSAVEFWESHLQKGNRLTAVSGSDDKLGEGYGRTITEVWAEQLSRPAVDEALRRGHAYVRGMGERSPELDLVAVEPEEGTKATFGDTLVADRAEMTLTVRGGDGQILSVRRNGTEAARVPIVGDEFTHDVAIDRSSDEGPLGTFWGAEVLDPEVVEGAETISVIANPVFLADQLPPEPELPKFAAPKSDTVRNGNEPRADETSTDGGSGALPLALAGVAAVVVLGGGAAAVAARRRRT